MDSMALPRVSGPPEISYSSFIASDLFLLALRIDASVNTRAC
jgi:hypothetical protein